MGEGKGGGSGPWTVCSGQCAVDSVQLAVGRGGQWALVNIWPWWLWGCSGQWTVDNGQWAAIVGIGHREQWAMESGLCPVGHGKGTVDSGSRP